MNRNSLLSTVIFSIFLALPFLALPLKAETLPTVDQFIEIALQQEYSAKISKLKRWQKPIRVQVHERFTPPAAVYPLIDELLSLLQQATRHSIERADAGGNVHLYFVSQAETSAVWREVARGKIPADALCAAQIKTNLDFEIESAIILIPVDRAAQRGRLLSCIVEELTQVTGLVNDSDSVYPSIFNDRSTNQMLTPLDWILLNTLYHPDLTPGMSEAEVRPRAARIIQSLAEANEAARGAKLIRATQLSELLNIN